MTEKINIIIASDCNYLCHATVVMLSVLINTDNPENVFFYFLDEGIGDENQSYLSQQICDLGSSIVFIDIDKSIFESFHISGHIKHSAYYRILAPLILPSNMTKALYLDSDLMLLKDISKLYSMNLEDAIIAAVEDSIEQDDMHMKLLNKVDRRYFNSGVLIIDLVKWREQNITEKVFDYIKENPEKLKYWDQDALNVIFDGRWHSLPYEWNVQTAFFDSEKYCESCSNPAIVHFTTDVKPWHIYSMHPYKAEYMQYRKLTRWKDIPLLNNFLLNKLDNGGKLIIFGTGGHAKRIVEAIDHEVSYFVDNSAAKVGELLFDKVIYSPTNLLLEQKDNIAIVIGSMYVNEITTQLELMGFEKKKQIFDLH